MKRWLLLVVFLAGIAATGIWLEGPWHGSSRSQGSQPGARQGACRLPVYVGSADIAGFVAVPGYAFTPAPGALSGGSRYPDGRWAYDAALGKWLPVDSRLVSADGQWWIYVTPINPAITADATIHLVDRHGVDRTVWSGHGLTIPIGWTARGAVFLYLAKSGAQSQTLMVAPTDGRIESLARMPGEFAGLDASGIWVMRDVYTAPPSDKNAPLHWTLTRIDLASGKATTWWDGESGVVQVYGFNGHGQPVVNIYPGAGAKSRFVLLTAPKTEEVIIADADSAAFVPISDIGDGDTVWFGDGRAQIWRWTPTEGLHMLADLQENGFAIVAGPCR